jgi:hypothetical protein
MSTVCRSVRSGGRDLYSAGGADAWEVDRADEKLHTSYATEDRTVSSPGPSSGTF